MQRGTDRVGRVFADTRHRRQQDRRQLHVAIRAVVVDDEQEPSELVALIPTQSDRRVDVTSIPHTNGCRAPLNPLPAPGTSGASARLGPRTPADVLTLLPTPERLHSVTSQLGGSRTGGRPHGHGRLTPSVDHRQDRPTKPAWDGSPMPTGSAMA